MLSPEHVEHARIAAEKAGVEAAIAYLDTKRVELVAETDAAIARAVAEERERWAKAICTNCAGGYVSRECPPEPAQDAGQCFVWPPDGPFVATGNPAGPGEESHVIVEEKVLPAMSDTIPPCPVCGGEVYMGTTPSFRVCCDCGYECARRNTEVGAWQEHATLCALVERGRTCEQNNHLGAIAELAYQLDQAIRERDAAREVLNCYEWDGVDGCGCPICDWCHMPSTHMGEPGTHAPNCRWLAATGRSETEEVSK
jgi:hypothetical protein